MKKFTSKALLSAMVFVTFTILKPPTTNAVFCEGEQIYLAFSFQADRILDHNTITNFIETSLQECVF